MPKKHANKKRVRGFGKFSEEHPQTEWNPPTEKEDRDMTLLRAFWYLDQAGTKWDALKGLVTDGASIPRAFWTLIGSPYTGRYRRAALVHDEACKDAAGNPVKRLEADEMFYNACRAGGCSRGEALILFIGVRIGAWLPYVATLQATDDDESARLSFSPQEQRLHADLRLVGERVGAAKPADDAKTVAREVDRVLRRLYPDVSPSKIGRKASFH